MTIDRHFAAAVLGEEETAFSAEADSATLGAGNAAKGKWLAALAAVMTGSRPVGGDDGLVEDDPPRGEGASGSQAVRRKVQQDVDEDVGHRRRGLL